MKPGWLCVPRLDRSCGSFYVSPVTSEHCKKVNDHLTSAHEAGGQLTSPLQHNTQVAGESHWWRQPLLVEVEQRGAPRSSAVYLVAASSLTLWPSLPEVPAFTLSLSLSLSLPLFICIIY